MTSLSANLYGASVNKGIGGLMSGLDTDDLVYQMTVTTRNKINRQYQSKQKLLYRQEAYREISSKLISFNNKYFSYSSGSKDNILSPAFFQSYTYKSSSNYVSVTGKAENIQNFSIDNITSVARAANFASKKRVSDDVIKSAELTDYVSTIDGGTMTIEYDGESYNLSIDKEFGKRNIGDPQITLADLANHLSEKIEKINGLEDLSVSAENGILSISSSDVNKKVTLTAASSSVLEVLKLEVGKAATSTSEVEQSSLIKEAADIMANENSYITFEYNGVLKQINLSPHTDAVQHLKTELNKAFGEGKIEVSVSQDNNELSFAVNDGDTNIFGISGISSELSNYLGIEAGDYNRINMSKTLAESGILGINNVNTIEKDGKEYYTLNINDVEIDFETTMSVKDIINKINTNVEAGVRVYYSSTTDTFMVKATETGSHKSISIGEDGGLAAALFGAETEHYEINKGTDTVIEYTLNGVSSTVTRSTANFTIDEINIELNERASDIDFTNPVTFDVINNSDEVVERVKQFIDDYNEIISLISSKTGEKPRNDYPPLTPDQQEEMSEEEIKNWTKEAKKGVLYGDRKMNNLLNSMRQAMSGFTDVSSLILSNIGISSANMDTSGKLVLNETKLKQKLLENPDEIARLFTNTASEADGRSGISIQLQTILRNNVGAFGTSGWLIEEAGIDNSMTSDRNYISEKIKEHDDKMAELKKYIERERERYWKQFSALEQSLNKLNMQSSWLVDMMGN